MLLIGVVDLGTVKIICIKWGTKYSAEYVNKLFRGIRNNTSKEFSFVCYTDNWKDITHPEIEIEPLPYSTGTWYNKIGLYNQDLYLPDDQVFYFDLDTVITGSLDDIFSYKGNFAILRDPYNKNLYGSGIMAWRPSSVNHMWENYTQGYKSPRGDQGWCEEQYAKADIWQEMYPEKLISYKIHIKGKGILSNRWAQHKGNLKSSSIVYFHGNPLPHQVTELPWMKEHWK